MKIFLGADHRGFELKEKLKNYLSEIGYQVEDCGPYQYDKDDDYVDFVSKVAQKVSEDPENNKGLILGMTGQGEAMVANKFKGVRAAVFYGPPFDFGYFLTIPFFADGSWRKIYEKIIKLSREHNNSNVLSIGTLFACEYSVKKAIKLWLETKFSGEERHVRRINKVKEIEQNG